MREADVHGAVLVATALHTWTAAAAISRFYVGSADATHPETIAWFVAATVLLVAGFVVYVYAMAVEKDEYMRRITHMASLATRNARRAATVVAAAAAAAVVACLLAVTKTIALSLALTVLGTGVFYVIIAFLGASAPWPPLRQRPAPSLHSISDEGVVVVGKQL